MASFHSPYPVNDARRRPPPLIMAEPNSRHPFDSYRNPEPTQYYRPQSPSEFSTPNSATFSTDQGSPRWGSGVASPISAHSRSHSMYASGTRTPGRRLSVPSGGNPFHSPHGANLRGPALNIPNSGTYSPNQGSLLSSPTVTPSGWSRRESISSAADDTWRRRTWHTDIRDLTGTSRLNQVITPPRYPPVSLSMPAGIPANQEGPIRLPGIASFDPLPYRPRSPPPRRIPSPMMMDSHAAHPHRQSSGVDYRRESTTQLQSGINRLEIHTPPRDSTGAWANDVHQAVQARSSDQARAVMEPTVRFEGDVKPAHVPTSMPPSSGPPMHGSRHQYTMSAPMISTPRESKRHGWYNGPVTVHPHGEPIQEGRPHVDRMIHPNVNAFQGFPGRESQPNLHSQPSHGVDRMSHGVDRMERIMERPHPTNNSRLDALVAVATNEGKAY